MNRILNVVRMHLENRWSYIGLPWAIVGVAFVLTLAIWAIVLNATGGGAENLYSGSASAIVIYEIVLAVQAINYTFPFALGFSATRREFTLGTVLTFLALAAVFAVALTVLAFVETVTHGWGLGGIMFVPSWAAPPDYLGIWFGWFALQTAAIAIGALSATVYMRWRATGSAVFWVCVAVLLVGVVAALTYTDGWAPVWRWVAATGPLGMSAWSLLVSAVLWLGSWLVLRRATPKG